MGEDLIFMATNPCDFKLSCRHSLKNPVAMGMKFQYNFWAEDFLVHFSSWLVFQPALWRGAKVQKNFVK